MCVESCMCLCGKLHVFVGKAACVCVERKEIHPRDTRYKLLKLLKYYVKSLKASRHAVYTSISKTSYSST